MEVYLAWAIIIFFLNAIRIAYLRSPPPEFPQLERKDAVEYGKRLQRSNNLPGRPNGAVTLYLLGWIDAYQMDDLLTARIAAPDKKMTPEMCGIYLDYKLVNQGHKYAPRPQKG